MNLIDALNRGIEIKERKTEFLFNQEAVEESRKIMETFRNFNHLYPGSIYKEVYDSLDSFLREYSFSHSSK